MSKVSRAALVGALGRYRVWIVAGREQPNLRVDVGKVRPVTCNPLFKVVNVSADFRTFEAQGGEKNLGEAMRGVFGSSCAD